MDGLHRYGFTSREPAPAADNTAPAGKRRKSDHLRLGASAGIDYQPWPGGKPVPVPVDQALGSQRTWLQKQFAAADVPGRPPKLWMSWVIITKHGLACAKCWGARHAVEHGPSHATSQTPWITCPCTNKDVATAIGFHVCGRKPKDGAATAATRHVLSCQWAAGPQSDMLEGTKQLQKREKAYIMRRLENVLFLAENYMAFDMYEPLAREDKRMGLIDAGEDVEAADGAGMPYTSSRSHRGLLQALALAVRGYWQPALTGPHRCERSSCMCDESGTKQHTAQNSIFRKTLAPGTGITVVLFAGMHVMVRGTARHLKLSLDAQNKRDGVPGHEIAWWSFDTCNTMFGVNAGLARLLRDEEPTTSPKKCVCHTGALAAKHGCDNVPFFKHHVVPLVESAGVQHHCSDKKHQFTKEENEASGTSAAAPALSSATRWVSRSNEVTKYVPAEHYRTQVRVFERAGTGGESDRFYESAGRADPTSFGIFTKLTTMEHVMGILVLAEILPRLADANKKLQSWSLTYDEHLDITDGLMGWLRGLVGAIGTDGWAAKAPLASSWRQFALDVQKDDGHGPVTIRRTRRRGDQWCDDQVSKLVVSMETEHRNIWPEHEFSKQLHRLFDIYDPGLPATGSPTDQMLNDHFDESFEVVAGKLCQWSASKGGLLIDRGVLRAGFESFRHNYISWARETGPKIIKRINADGKKGTDDARAAEAKRGIAATDRTPHFKPVAKAPISELIKLRLELEYEKQDRNQPMVMLMEQKLTELFQQAPVEASFSKVKRILSTQRLSMTQGHLEMLMHVLCNGPSSYSGQRAGFTRQQLLDDAYDIWCAMSVRRLQVASVAHEAIEDRYKFGENYASDPDYDQVSADCEAEQLANHRKRIATAPVNSPSHTWIKSTERAGGGGTQLVDRAVPPDHNGCTPQPNDELAVSGFGGTTWYTGTIVAVDLSNKGKPYRTLFPADAKYSDLALKPSNYGPAAVTPAFGDQPEHVVGGWYYLAPTIEAGGQASSHMHIDT